MWQYFALERTQVKTFLEDAKKERLEGIKWSWKQESPAKEILEQVKRAAGLECTAKMMKWTFYALKEGMWEEFTEQFKAEINASEWTLERMYRAFEKVAKDEAGSLSIVQSIMLQSTDFLRHIIREALPVVCVPTLQLFSARGLDLVGFVRAW